MLTVDSAAATSSSLDLKPHVGHQIEVTGTVAGGGGRRGGDTAPPTSTGAPPTSTGQGRGTRSMTITAIKMISDSCTKE